MTVLVATTASGPAFNKPAYRYIRTTDRLPGTDAAHAEKDPLVRVKLFNPTGAGYWYLCGHDPETGLAWGAARIHELEVGDFDMNEVVALRGRGGLPVERDVYWTPKRLSRLLEDGR